MEPDVCLAPALIGELCLDKWEVIGSGGFGQIFKARHIQWVWDVAIKILHHDDGSSSHLLLREARLMQRGESPYVVRVSGVFRGRLPNSGPSVHLGLVMDYMEQGSLADLQGVLCGPPPWPLAFRLAYQVALGMNFLHTLSPPLLHLDLKPSNVLLDTCLNVKLTDFGLAKIYNSVSQRSKLGSVVEGGTTSYMPPEAFRMDYKPTCASDIYSYGMLLWSILTGQKPYKNAFSSLVRIRIPEGDRPPLDDIDPSLAEGLGPLVEMISRCWGSIPQQRPTFLECISVTEKQYNIHRSGINTAVNDTHSLLEKEREERKLSNGLTKLHITQSTSMNVPTDNLTGPSPVQETAGGQTMKNQIPCSPDMSSSRRVSDTKHTNTSTNEEEVSSMTLNPAPETPPAALERTTQSNQAGKTQKVRFRPTVPGSYQRQLSNPEPAMVYINQSSVIGFQKGNNNHMHICTSDVHADRRRHPSAPPMFNSTDPQFKSRKEQTAKY